jgi:NADH-quinone oxidoreductase subunit L
VLSKHFFKQAAWIGTGLVFLSIISSCLLFKDIWISENTYTDAFQWFSLKGKSFEVSIWIDKTSALLLWVVSLVSFLVHLFSISYMEKEKHLGRYFALLGVFTFAMQSLLLSSNLLIIYIFWELVGFCSYLLIGFWHEKPAAAHAAKKAFLVNRVGDTGFLLAIVLVWFSFNSLDLQAISHQNFGNPHFAFFIGIGFVLALCAKSAQLPLSVWLPSAMEGPTPVSALIHAATMVAAGVYLLIRVYFLLPAEILSFLVIIGTATAFFSAFSALSQTDIKKVLAYSTISQLGYMTVALGIGATQIALFHLFTHAFFKAGLFLCAGAIIHALHEQDMNKMGGLRKAMPITFVCYSICAFSLAGLPLFSGFLSKDLILSQVQLWASASGWKWGIWIVLVLTSLLTAIYIGRQWSLVFIKTPSENTPTRQRESFTSSFPLIVLAIFSVGFFYSSNPFLPEDAWILVLEGYEVTHWLTVLSASLAVFGVFFAWCLYSCENVRQNAVMRVVLNSSLYRFSYHFFYLDAFYTKISHRSWAWFSQKIADISFLDHLYEKYITDEGLHLTKQHENLRINKLRKIFDLTVLGFVAVAWAKRLAKFDNRRLDRAVNLSGIFLVSIGYATAWIDKYLIDSFVKALTILALRIGWVLRSMQGGKVQLYFAWAMIGVLIVCVLLVL